LRKIRFYQLFIVLMLAILIVGVVLFALSWMRQDEDKVIGSLPPQGTILELPQLPLTPQTMTPAERQAAIDEAVFDARGAALASGQTEEQAQEAANRARAAALKIFSANKP